MARRYLVALSTDVKLQFGYISFADTSSKENYAILDLTRAEVTKGIVIAFLQTAYWCKALYFCKDFSWVTPKTEDVVSNWDIGVMIHQILGSSSGFSPASKDLFKRLP